MAENQSWTGFLFRGTRFTRSRYNSMIASQSSACALCGAVPGTAGAPDKRLAVDHDHDTNEVRELLCGSCNIVLGHLGEDPAYLEEWARAALAYLKKHSARPGRRVPPFSKRTPPQT